METKQLVVKLDRLSESDIKNIINSIQKADVNVTNTINFVLNMESTGWRCTAMDGKVTPINISEDTIEINLRTNAVDDITKESDGQPQKHFEEKNLPIIVDQTSSEPIKTIKIINDATRKRQLWAACKKEANLDQLNVGTLVFAKQKGYSPWPGKIIGLTKTKSSAVVEYFGYNNLKGTVKTNEIVPTNESNKNVISALIHATMTTGNVREFSCFVKAIAEYKMVADSIN